VVGGAGEREHVDAETGLIRKRWQRLRARQPRFRKQDQARKKRGTRNAERGTDETRNGEGGTDETRNGERGTGNCGGKFDLPGWLPVSTAGRSVPRSAFRVPHSLSLSACRRPASSGLP